MIKVASYQYAGDILCKRRDLAVRCHWLSVMGEVGFTVTDTGRVELWATERRSEEIAALVTGGVL